MKFDTDLDADDLKEVIKRYKGIYRKALNEEFPQDPKDQLFEAIKAVFRSWDNPRAIYYRRMNDIPGDWGTAVNVQTMVFGNMGDTSGTGVAFTRNPSTGEKQIYGEYLINAQGEDVVAGVRTPQPITKLAEDLPVVINSLWTLLIHWKNIIVICRIWNLQFRKENCTSYRQEMVREQPQLHSVSPVN